MDQNVVTIISWVCWIDITIIGLSFHTARNCCRAPPFFSLLILFIEVLNTFLYGTDPLVELIEPTLNECLKLIPESRFLGLPLLLRLLQEHC